MELSGVQFGLKSYASFQSCSIWNHTNDFRPKLPDMKFNRHFITASLKSQNSVSATILSI